MPTSWFHTPSRPVLAGCAAHLVFPSLLVATGCLAGAPARSGSVSTQGAHASRGGQNAPADAKHSLLARADFADGKSLPWNTVFSAPADGRAFVENGELCLEVQNKGTNRYDVQLRHRDMTIRQGHAYHVRFDLRATTKMRAVAKVGEAGPPYHDWWLKAVNIGPERVTVDETFTMKGADDPTAEIAFHLGGPMATAAPYTVCLNNVYLTDPTFTPPLQAAAAPVPSVLVNQVGYFPGRAKIATVKSDSRTPLGWTLTAGASVVASGETTPVGQDTASGNAVHVLDFSRYDKPGQELVLHVGAVASHPFSVAPRLYNRLKYDALAFFYHQRSGIEIAMPYAGAPTWTRPAGHVGDAQVPCAPDAGCDDVLDVHGGWYDAGDHGKYVVNAGVSVWTLLNLYERSLHEGGSVAAFADGTLNIPEHANGVPDLLDEVRWELAWEMRMQVPEGKPLAGMVHHKVHDKAWTALGLAPHEDKMPRFVFAPSTAATLNLAANAAQCARLYGPHDKAFAAQCLAAAERAWQAALAHPDLFAKPGGTGGGPYDDDLVKDDFYWAAAELYLTTHKSTYRDFVLASPYAAGLSPKARPQDEGSHLTPFTWADTAALGTLSLVTVPNPLGQAELAKLRRSVVVAADAYLAAAAQQGYRVPFAPGPKGYPWGSNSFVLDNALCLAVAHDLSRDPKYLDGVVMAMDYLLGRNPLDQSYVTGYGARPLENPHHRFWSHQINARYPSAPPGLVSGGPNSGLEDPYVQAAGLKGCAPETCFVDHIEAWSANEITINWNAPLVWVAAYLDEHAGGKGHPGTTGGTVTKEGRPKGKAKR
jgi:endoglucanase